MVDDRRRRDREGGARGAHHRDPARAGELSALAASAAAEVARGGQEGPAPSAIARAGQTRGQARATRLAQTAAAAVLTARALLRAAASLSRGVRARAGD